MNGRRLLYKRTLSGCECAIAGCAVPGTGERGIRKKWIIPSASGMNVMPVMTAEY